jgi:type III secretory pathway component EscR
MFTHVPAMNPLRKFLSIWSQTENHKFMQKSQIEREKERERRKNLEINSTSHKEQIHSTKMNS